MSQPPFDIAQAHRWFAIEFNNRAWDLVEQSSHTAQETVEMIHLAHAAALHWLVVGTKLNEQRAENLLATAYLKVKQPQPAMLHAMRGLALSEKNAAEETSFDRATTLAAAARANELAGNQQEAERLWPLASAAVESLTADDRAVFDKLYGSHSR